MLLRTLALCLIIGLAACTGPAPGSVATGSAEAPPAPIAEADVERHLRFLAADELMGRKAGTPGNDIAARYIAEQFRHAGAAPAGTDGFLQPIPFVQTQPPRAGHFALGEDTLRQGERLLILGGEAARLQAPPVFVGYGLEAADYARQDVAGRIVVTQAGRPDARGPREAIQALAEKQALADAAGAAALVELYAGAYPWGNLVSFLSRPRFGLADADPPRLPTAWADDADGRLRAALVDDPADGMLESPGFVRAPATSSNVAAWIEGRDPAVADEYVILMAHYDHVGAGMRNGAGATPADSIFNGARDNGIGTVALIETAHALAAAPPRRSVLLLALTAEEDGLLGSRYYVEHPLRPLRRAVFGLNIDGAGYSDTTIVTVAGWGRTGADVFVRQAAQTQGLEVLGDPVPEQNLFERSDNVVFAHRGIPAPTISTGFRQFTDPGIADYYHRPEDEVTPDFAFGYVTRFIRTFAQTARLVADADPAPTWTPGDPYEAAAQTLYGTD